VFQKLRKATGLNLVVKDLDGLHEFLDSISIDFIVNQKKLRSKMRTTGSKMRSTGSNRIKAPTLNLPEPLSAAACRRAIPPKQF
jgi:hypothetical protein